MSILQPYEPDPSTQTLTASLRVPVSLQGDRALYYSKRSRLIVLDGPRGPLLAYYHSATLPDPELHKFHCIYPRNYPVFKGRVPEKTPADVHAIAYPIDHVADNRSPVLSGGPPSIDADLAPSAEDIELIPPSENSRPRGMTQPGLRISPRGVVAHFEGGGFTVDRDGLRIEGALQTQQVTSRGVTKESPLWGVLPKTAVTFTSADVIPDGSKLNRYAQIIMLLAVAYKAIARFAELLDASFADDLPDLS